MNSVYAIEKTDAGTGVYNLERLQSVLFRYCMSITGSGWDAEDLAQDTWLKALGIINSAGHTNPEALLLRIAKNTWIDRTRRKTVLNRILTLERPKETQPDNGSIEMEAAFQALIKHLSPLQRTVFLLRDVFGYSIAETAERLETTAGAVKAALSRARQSLPAVRTELENGGSPLSGDEGLLAYAQAYAAAYQMTDIAVLVELSRQGEADPAAVAAIVQTRLQLRKSFRVRVAGTRPDVRMAA